MPAVVFGPSPPSSPSLPQPSTPTFSLQTLAIPFVPDGLLLYLSAAHYESGSTPLVAWVPLEVKEEGERGKEGVERMKELVEEWERRGGEAATGWTDEGGEVVMGGA
jgi:hypothetical protein